MKRNEPHEGGGGGGDGRGYPHLTFVLDKTVELV